MNQEQRNRLLRSSKTLAIAILIGMAYFVFVKLTGWGIPCIFHLLTDRYCPGCGISRMFLALAQLDFKTAFQCNALVMLLLPFGILLGIRRWVLYVKNGSLNTDLLEKILIFPVFLLTVAFWILRNLEQFSYLAPK